MPVRRQTTQLAFAETASRIQPGLAASPFAPATPPLALAGTLLVPPPSAAVIGLAVQAVFLHACLGFDTTETHVFWDPSITHIQSGLQASDHLFAKVISGELSHLSSCNGASLPSLALSL